MIRPLLLLALLLSALATHAQQPKSCGTSILARHRTAQGVEEGDFGGGHFGDGLKVEGGGRIDSAQGLSSFNPPPSTLHQKRALHQKAPSSLQGEKRGLVILVSFPNCQFSSADPASEWGDVINLRGYGGHDAPGSVSDYYYDQSYGQFRINFDVAGPVEAAHPYAYYGRNIDWGGNDWFDQADGQLVEEACRGVADKVSFADYDWDGDGYVEMVFLLYAGYGESDYWDKSEDVIWPHQGVLSVDWSHDYPKGLQLQGVTIDTYACSSELVANGQLAGHGTICHEFSHCLGLVDLYDTVNGYSVVGHYDLMDSGNYNGRGWCPPGFSAYERYACGWLTPEAVDNPQAVGTLAPLHLEPDARIYREHPSDNAYYIIENRANESWDRSLPRHGLMAWRVDYDEQAWLDNKVNTDPQHYRLQRVELEDIPTAILALRKEDCYSRNEEGGRRRENSAEGQNHPQDISPSSFLLPRSSKNVAIRILRYPDGTVKKVITNSQ